MVAAVNVAWARLMMLWPICRAVKGRPQEGCDGGQMSLTRADGWTGAALLCCTAALLGSEILAVGRARTRRLLLLLLLRVVLGRALRALPKVGGGGPARIF